MRRADSSKFIDDFMVCNAPTFVILWIYLYTKDKSIEIINFVLDVILCAVSFVLNIGLFSAKYKTPIVGKIGLLFATLCFAAFTYFAFLMPENGLPPVLFS